MILPENLTVVVVVSNFASERGKGYVISNVDIKSIAIALYSPSCMYVITDVIACMLCIIPCVIYTVQDPGLTTNTP